MRIKILTGLSYLVGVTVVIIIVISILNPTVYKIGSDKIETVVHKNFGLILDLNGDGLCANEISIAEFYNIEDENSIMKLPFIFYLSVFMLWSNQMCIMVALDNINAKIAVLKVKDEDKSNSILKKE